MNDDTTAPRWCSHPDAPVVLEELERIARVLKAGEVVVEDSADEDFVERVRVALGAERCPLCPRLASKPGTLEYLEEAMRTHRVHVAEHRQRPPAPVTTTEEEP